MPKPDLPPQGDLPDLPEEDRRRLTIENAIILRALQTISEQARRDRHRQTAVILTVASGLFLIRTMLPPAWVVWLPL